MNKQQIYSVFILQLIAGVNDKKLSDAQKEVVSLLSTDVLKKLTGHAPHKIEIEPTTHLFGHQRMTATHPSFNAYAYLNADLQFTAFSIDSKDALLDGHEKKDKASYLPYAKQVYQIIYGSDPIGKNSLLHEGTGLTEEDQQEVAYWRHQIKGLTTHHHTSVSLQLKKEKSTHPWYLSTTKGLSIKDVHSISNELKKITVKLSDDEAYAIALKALEKLNCLEKQSPFTRISLYRDKLTMQINVPTFSQSERDISKQWKAKGAKEIDLLTPRYCTRITFTQGQRENEVFIDWTTKQILHINSYTRICW